MKLNKNDKLVNDNNIRINKFLSIFGFCSRRQADVLIENKRVLINGYIAKIGDKVNESDNITVDGHPIDKKMSTVILVFNKPKGLVCTTSKKDKRNIIDYLNLNYRVFPIGRLDKASHGLLLLTNDGSIVNKILKSSNYHEKEYVVKVDKDIDDLFLKKMSNGVHIVDKEKNIDVVTRNCKCKKISKNSFSIILTQGINRQIRRMCAILGYKVLDLKRIRIMNICLDDLKIGNYRKLSLKEISNLNRLLR